MARDGSDDRQRLFVAIDLTEEARGALAEAQAVCRRCRLPVRWVAPHSAHLTLKFLGEIPATQTAALEAALVATSARHAPFLLWTGPPGAFPSLRRPRVLWLGVAGATDCLDDLQQDVEFALHDLGFPLTDHAYHPHLTLGRVRDGASLDGAGLAAVLAELQGAIPASFPVQELRLMRSALGADGPRYTTLAVAPLGSAGF